VAQAGRVGAVTVATNMAGRGVDIILGGKPPDYNPEEDLQRYIFEGHASFIQQAETFLKDDPDFSRWIQERKLLLRSKAQEIKLSEGDWEYSYLKGKPGESSASDSEGIAPIEAKTDLLSEALASDISKWDDEVEEKLKRKSEELAKLGKADISERIKAILRFKSAKAKHKQAIDDLIQEHRLKFKNWFEEHKKVVELGGLHIIGTERHEARRIDNQLRGRAGRQGDPGYSRFYVSLEDDVVKRFGGDRIKGIMERFKFDENLPIENMMVNKAIEGAQTKIEGYNFDIRKHLVDYDDVVNKHREVIYGERRKILSGSDIKANITSMMTKEIQGICAVYLGKGDAAEIDAAAFLKDIGNILPLPPELNAAAVKQMDRVAIEERLLKRIDETYEQREVEFGADKMRLMERLIMLRMIDRAWVEHLTSMEQMRQSAGLEAMGQRDPLVIYKQRGNETFQALKAGIEHDVATTIFRVKIEEKQGPSPMAQAAKRPEKAVADKGTPGRNDPCPCGSGKKYKKCCGQ
jgi:preprotein translocase subunit SecA